MNRLKAILAPASPAGPRSRQAVVGLAAMIAGVACTGSLAIAAQRQPVFAPAPMDVAASRMPTFEPAAAPRPTATLSPGRADQPTPIPAVAPAPRPQPIIAAAPVEVAAPLTGAAGAQEPPPPAEITQVTWSQHPTPMYPAVAAANGVAGGVVTLACAVEADGRASGCNVLAESPENNGFGEAALASMEGARFTPAMMETAKPGARARFTIRFRMAE